jgi:putative spermidine/putrescine transport system ATP-binding protein/spermidine/putrescine transport system ATP-binding protein
LVAVDVASITKSYGFSAVLDGVSMTFEAGRLTTLLGPSGSGKTTLLRIVGGFVAPDAGQIRFGAEDVTGTPVWRRNIGMVFQSYALFPHMTVFQNVVFGLNRRGIRGSTAKWEVMRALEMVHLTGFEHRRPKELSGGQQQRVALARAIVTRPQVLLLDEPLSALDRRLRQDMQIELRRIQRESGLTTVFVTHDQEEALALSDRVAILDRGRIVQQGVPADIYERPRTRFAASFLGDANFFAGRVVPEGIQTAGGLVQVEEKLPEVGSAVTVAVRPEKMTIRPADALLNDENRIEGTLQEIVYAGAISTFILRTTDGSEVKVFNQNAEPSALRPGIRVAATWPRGRTIVLEA